MMKRQFKLWSLALLCALAYTTPVLAAEVAGTVSFVVGVASVAGTGTDAALRQLRRGDAVDVGQTLVTGPNGHVHLKMQDGAFVSVRPQSRFKIEQYHYDAQVPANNRIKFVLEEGIARSITGRAGAAARSNYRLNTPLAAIGIRGTDFVVQATAEATRVTVQSGAVSFTPLAGDCLASGLGPCASATTRVLTAAMRDGYLELSRQAGTPVLVPAERAVNNPNAVSPPRPEEPKAIDDKTVGRADTKDAILNQSVNAVLGAAHAPDAPAAVMPASLPTPATLPTPPTQFYWGRWSRFIQPGQEASSIEALLAPGREVLASNSVFVLSRDDGLPHMPATGVAKFQLAGSEAYVMSDTKTLSAATIAAPALTVNFAARTYDTALTVNGGALGMVGIASSGQVSGQGQFIPAVNSANTTIGGFLSSDVSQAGYVFERGGLPNGASVVGVTRWLR
ncbi:MAG: FecR family protein [Burkholderiaceae bacterium]